MWFKPKLGPKRNFRRGKLSYKFERLAGEGLTSEIWKGRRIDGKSETDVAIKILKSGISDRTLRRELQVIHQLRSVSSLRAYEIQHFKGRPALILEWIEGVSLHELMKSSPEQDLVGLIAKDLAQALSDLQSSNLYHGDLSPRNIMIDINGRVRLIDFGHFETEQQLVGTPEFLSPERWQGSAPDLAADLYSFEAILKWAKWADSEMGLMTTDAGERLKVFANLNHTYIIEGSDADALRSRLSSIIRELKSEPRESTRVLISRAPIPISISLRYAVAGAMAILAPVSAHVRPSEGRVSVRGECWVRVHADGRELGFAPISFLLARGRHQINLKTSHQSREEIIDIHPSDEVLILARMTRKGCVAEKMMKPSS